MKITIENTSKVVMLKTGPLGEVVPARIWEGETELGIKVHCFITRIAVRNDEPRKEEFEKDLQSTRAPSPDIEAYPLRLIL
jgi:hypothetical protein